ncbi:MAG: type II secretion system protein [Fibrobacteria bacterium]|nr:type II secretion system protein [Fibrobacteria bacterium]
MRKGFTLIEILVSLVILGLITTMAMRVFRSQHQSWKSESDRADIALMAKGTLEEIGRAIRMTGGALPQGAGGIRIWTTTEPGVTFVLNQTQWADTAYGSTYLPGERKLRVAIDSAAKFSDSGFVILSATSTATSTTDVYRLPILERVTRFGSCTKDSLVLDAGILVDPPNSFSTSADISVPSNTLVFNLDSISYFKSHDSLFYKANQNPPMLFALGIDTLKFSYFHPVDGWRSGLSTSNPAGRIDMVRIRLVMRTLKASRSLLEKDSTSRGHRFIRLETEVSMRNDSLVNL